MAAMAGNPGMPQATPTDLMVTAIKLNDIELCKTIGESQPESLHGCDSSDGGTPAHWAALHGRLDALEWLHEMGAPLHNAVDSSGMQPIHWAATRGQLEVAKFLLANGGDINAVDVKQTTPLVIAAQYDQTVLVFYLVKQKADINLLDNCKDSALHWAAYKGNQHSVALLHYLGLPADSADEYGSTPLHLAASRGCTSVVEYLLDAHDAEKLASAKDNKGREPLSLAMERGHMDIARQLKLVKPNLAMRLMKIFGGNDGSKIFFVFFLANSNLAYLFYYLRLAPALTAAAATSTNFTWLPQQHLLYLAVNVPLYLFYLTALFTEPGAVAGTRELHQKYERALETAAEGKLEEAVQAPLCHTCRIIRPLRSKHCTKLKKCVSLFDHYCPYVNTTIGAYNYRSFVLFMLFGFFGVNLTWIACAEYLYLVGFDPLVLLVLVDYVAFGAMAVVMNAYHAYLLLANLTTNEHINRSRYVYLKDEMGRYKNAFDYGKLANFVEFWTRASLISNNPYVYTERFQQLQSRNKTDTEMSTVEGLAGTQALLNHDHA